MKIIELCFYSALTLISCLFLTKPYLYALYWLIIGIILFIKYGKYKSKSILKSYVIRTLLIAVLAYLFFTYALGLITGFNYNVFDTSIMGIIKNAYPFVISIIAQELIRFKFARNSKNKNKRIYILITIVLYLSDIVMTGGYSSLKSSEQIFIYISTTVVPKMFFHALYSYITYVVGFGPSIIIRLPLTIYIYFVPILPDLGNYLNSVIGVLIPSIVYKNISKAVDYYNKNDLKISKFNNKLIFVPVLIILIILVLLVSGLGTYQIVSIGSGSMEPVFYRGDAVIIDQSKSAADLEIGDVVAVYQSGRTITHRIIGIKEESGHYTIVTKGDNNEDADAFTSSEDEVEGKVIYAIKYIGYPTIMVNEFFGKIKN